MWTEYNPPSKSRPGNYARALRPAMSNLLCVHGSGGDGPEFAVMFECLAGRANAAALDLAGHGSTAGPALTSVKDYADWVMGFLAGRIGAALSYWATPWAGPSP